MARKLSVAVGHGLCVGNAICITIATKTFTLNDDRQAIPADVDADSEEADHGCGGKLPGGRHAGSRR